MPLPHDHLVVSVQVLRTGGKWGHLDSRMLYRHLVAAGAPYNQRVLDTSPARWTAAAPVNRAWGGDVPQTAPLTRQTARTTRRQGLQGPRLGLWPAEPVTGDPARRRHPTQLITPRSRKR